MSSKRKNKIEGTDAATPCREKDSGTHADGVGGSDGSGTREGVGEVNDREYGGPRGLDPTRYGDWERKGRCIDF